MSILPEKLQRYRKFLSFMIKYWNSDLVSNAASNAINDEPKPHDIQYDPSPGELVEDIKTMGPTFIKMGQLLSTRPDLLPDAYLEALASLQDHVPPIEFDKVREIIEEELGIRFSKAFSEFEKEPLASASIGQVHTATLPSGKKVVVKVQRPGIRQQFLEDLDTLEEMIHVATKHSKMVRQYALDQLMHDLRRILLNELNYNREEQNLITLGENIKKFPNLIVPQPIADYTSSRVLTMDHIQGRKVTDISPLTQVEMDCTVLVDELVEAYLKQIVSDGFVHADPHPGNIHLTQDNRIALLDLGMVARISRDMQESLLQILIALSESNGDDVAAILLKIGEQQPQSDPRQFQKVISAIVMDAEQVTTKDLQIGKLIIRMNRAAAHNGILIPTEITILGKILLNLDQIIAKLAPGFDLKAALKRHTLRVMRSKMWAEFKPENLLNTALETKNLLEHLPERLNKISKHLADNNMRLNIDALDEKRFTDAFQKLANRITLGLVIAAMIVGAAMLMNIKTGFTIWGYPAFAILLFLFAVVLGLVLSYIIIFKDENLK